MTRLTVAAIVTSVLTCVAGRASAQTSSGVPAGQNTGNLRGFSIVLVEGDTAAGAVSDSVPAAAAAALADLKNFLPYKSYRLLDSEWTLGGENTRTVLLGPDGQRYTLQLVAETQGGSDVNVATFRLEPTAIMARSPAATRSADQAARSDALKKQVAAMSARLTELRRTLGPNHPDILRLQQELLQAQAVLASTTGPTSPEGPGVPFSTIDTAFRLKLGETIIVGTSRLQGTKALVVLLTAVSR
jgi:hypothetical protein